MDPKNTPIFGVCIVNDNRDRHPLTHVAIRSFLSQEYSGTTRLVLLLNADDLHSFKYLNDSAVIKLIKPPNATIGELRNFAHDHVLRNLRVRGNRYIVQWDDDDFSTKDRLTYQVTNTPLKGISLLQQCLQVNLLNGFSFHKKTQVGELCGITSSIMFPVGDAGLAYQPVIRREDVLFLKLIHSLRKSVTVLDNDACIYTRLYDGHNVVTQKDIMAVEAGSRELDERERTYLQWLLPTKYFSA